MTSLRDAWNDLDNPLSRSALKTIWAPGIVLTIQAIKYLGALDCNCKTIFRTWLGPSILTSAPWTQWLHYSPCPIGGVPSCDILAAPYSILWYLFWMPWAWNYLVANLFAITIDSIFLVWTWRNNPYWLVIIYQSISFYILLTLPTDMLIVWGVFLSFQHWSFIGIAPLLKFPIGAPKYVWDFILYSPYSIHDPENIVRYGIFGVLWCSAYAWWILKRYPLRHKAYLVKSDGKWHRIVIPRR